MDGISDLQRNNSLIIILVFNGISDLEKRFIRRLKDQEKKNVWEIIWKNDERKKKKKRIIIWGG